jgi:hypothetical protein
MAPRSARVPWLPAVLADRPADGDRPPAPTGAPARRTTFHTTQRGHRMTGGHPREVLDESCDTLA